MPSGWFRDASNPQPADLNCNALGHCLGVLVDLLGVDLVVANMEDKRRRRSF